MTDMFPDAPVSAVSINDQISCVERELRTRSRVYARLVHEKKMTQGLMDRELRHMRAVLDTLNNLKGA